MQLPSLTVLLCAASMLACGPSSGTSEGSNGADEGAGDGTGTSEAGDGAADDAGSTEDSTTDASTTVTDSGDADTGDPDCETPCDPSTPGDCPEGMKCTALSCDGAPTYDANACVPIGGDKGPGEDCSGGGLNGTDDCAEGLMCWSNVCVEFCAGDAPQCDDGQICAELSQGILPLCLTECDPLGPECTNPLDVCLPYDALGFVCFPQAVIGPGTYGASCDQAANSCNHGLVCTPASDVGHPDCEGSANCCAPLCDLQAPNCPDAGFATTCEPYYELGTAPEGYEDLGICG